MGASLGELIPELQEFAQDLYDLAVRAGANPRITSTVRSRAEQSRLYRRFLSGAARFPAAPPGLSAHEYGYAFDMVVPSEEDQLDLGSVWQGWGGVWSRKDFIHFEYPGFKPPASVSSESTVRQQVNAGIPLTLSDVFVGSGLAEILSLFLPESSVLHWLSSPVSTFKKRYPDIFSYLMTYYQATGMGGLAEIIF